MLKDAVMQDAQAQQGFALQQVSKAASDLGEATMAMPGMVHLQQASQFLLTDWLTWHTWTLARLSLEDLML